MDAAACAQTDPDLFFQDGPGTLAKKICAGCEVRQRCLNYALTNDMDHGIWGGTGTRNRKLMKRNIA